MKNKLTVFLTALLMSFSTSAFSFEGFSIGATYSSLDFSTSGKEISRDTTAVMKETPTSKSGSGDLGLVFAEYTFSQGTTIGVEHISGTAELGKGSRTNSSVATDSGSVNGTVNVKADISDPTTFYVEPTWMANDRFGIYLKGGATRVTIQPKETSDAGNVVTSTYGDKDVWGIMTGFGAKVYYNNFFVKAEYVETEFETYSFTSTTTNSDKNTINADVDTEETRISIGYNF